MYKINIVRQKRLFLVIFYNHRVKVIIMRGISMFSSAGIGETFLNELNINIVAANELLPRRAQLYNDIYMHDSMVQGDILDDNIFQQYLEKSGDNIDFLIASPPCQGMSIAGKNRSIEDMISDSRNNLIFKVMEVIELKKPTYIMIENVPALMKILLFYNNELKSVIDILNEKFNEEYEIDAAIIDAADLGVPQYRKRAIIKLWKKGLKWPWPSKEKHKTVCETIGHLPSLESGQNSDIQWHFARNHDERHVLWMKHTPTGKSAFENDEFYPIKKDGTAIKGYNTTYRRMEWDKPAPTITIRNDAISSQKNVHPGRLKLNGEYSDARVLTVYELMLLNSLPDDWNIPDNTSEILIRQCIGESIPPLMVKKIVAEIQNGGNYDE